MLLLTGHKGFIGSHLTKLLAENHIPFVGYDLKDGYDIRDKHQLDEFFEKNQITEVVHMAALAGVRRSIKYPKDYIDTNVLGTQNIVDMCNEYKVEKLIFFSSSSVFGAPKVLDKIYGKIKGKKETDEKEPLSLYGITKLAGEKIVNNAKCKTTIIRPFTVYGENGRKDEVVFKWIEQIKNRKPITVFGDGDSYRGYVYVKDLVKEVKHLLKVGWFWQHNDFNLGGSEVIYLKDILNTFEKYFEFKIDRQEMPNSDIYGQYADLTKASITLGFRPEPNFIKNLENILSEYTQKLSPVNSTIPKHFKVEVHYEEDKEPDTLKENIYEA